ncbi:alanine racemase [Psychromonas sp. MB-3u-54]|uniref:alanine racemase n=1 Tax=Psychromonas sp. MB-3u-54 TaxID=2058319 RepID=UPI000C3200F6|nr:alanine racemase [Psychromonas sp. MB-3u-54]PKH01154.1 alanine racemase [Psychromonas sp. MB-3u-54]
MDSTRAVINLKALRHNLQILQRTAPQSQIIAVIKANAYGHGIVKVAQTLQHVHAFAVARLSEALTLRSTGIHNPIILLGGFFNGSDLTTLAAKDLQCVVHSQEQVAAIMQAKLPVPLKIWLKLDTGMHRLGFHPEQFDAVYKCLMDSENVQKPIDLLTHFHSADEVNNNATAQQLSIFQQHIQTSSGLKSLANSAAVFAWPETHFDAVRPGIALYGISPFADISARDLQLRPVMTLKSVLIAVRDHKAGENVGYGTHWTARNDTRIGVVAMGYGDGYPRLAPEGTPVLVNGRIVPLVGRVSMDMLTVDLGLGDQDKVGDDVTLWGEGLPAERVAQKIGTIAYELVTKLTSRVTLHYQE